MPGWPNEVRESDDPPAYRFLARDTETALAPPPPAYQSQQWYHDEQHIAAVESQVAERALRRSKRNEEAPRHRKGVKAWCKEHRAGLGFMLVLLVIGAVILLIGLLQHFKGLSESAEPCKFNERRSISCHGAYESPICAYDFQLTSIDIPAELHGWNGYQAENGTLYACKPSRAESLSGLSVTACMMARCLDPSCEMLGPMCDWL